MIHKYLNKEKFRYLFYVLTHPVDGFYEIRHRDRGSVPLALLITVCFSLCFSMNRLMASFVVNDIDPRTVNSWFELKAIIVLLLLFCVGNWSITCLMEGEGRLKDIVIVAGYSLTPLILTFVPATILSNFIASNEEAFYIIILVAGIVWALILVLIGIMTVHNYSIAKTLLTIVLTFVAVTIIMFIWLMLNDLISQVYGFFYSIYLELIFRN